MYDSCRHGYHPVLRFCILRFWETSTSNDFDREYTSINMINTSSEYFLEQSPLKEKKKINFQGTVGFHFSRGCGLDLCGFFYFLFWYS